MGDGFKSKNTACIGTITPTDNDYFDPFILISIYPKKKKFPFLSEISNIRVLLSKANTLLLYIYIHIHI